MGRQYFEDPFIWSVASGAAVANTVTETILFPNALVPANYVHDGRVLHGVASGVYSNTGTPTAVISLRWGGVAGTLLAKTGAVIQQNGIATGNWWLEYVAHCRSNGATGTMMVTGVCHFFASAAPTVGTGTQAAGTTPFSLGGQTGPGVATVDLTADANLSLTVTWSAASASNTIQGLNHLITVPN